MKPHTPCNCLALRQAARHLTQYYDRLLAPSGLRSTQFSILAKLEWLGPSTINTLANELVMDRTTLGRTMLTLQRDGFIAVKNSSSDRRSKELQLTESGVTRLGIARELWNDAQKHFEKEFGSDRSSKLRKELRAVISTVL